MTYRVIQWATGAQGVTSAHDPVRQGHRREHGGDATEELYGVDPNDFEELPPWIGMT